MNAVLLACSVCGTVTPAQQAVYLGSTAFLSFLPLVAIGLVVMWVLREVRSGDQAIGRQDQGGSGSQQGAREQAAQAIPFRQHHPASHHAQAHEGHPDGGEGLVFPQAIYPTPGIRPGSEEPCPS